MGRYWWTVWIKVAVMAVVLLIAYSAVSQYVKHTFEPYLLKESASQETEPPVSEEIDSEDATEERSASDTIKQIVQKAESFAGSYIDYESFIFDYANDYAQRMMEESRQERNVISEPLS